MQQNAATRHTRLVPTQHKTVQQQPQKPGPADDSLSQGHPIAAALGLILGLIITAAALYFGVKLWVRLWRVALGYREVRILHEYPEKR